MSKTIWTPDYSFSKTVWQLMIISTMGKTVWHFSIPFCAMMEIDGRSEQLLDSLHKYSTLGNITSAMFKTKCPYANNKHALCINGVADGGSGGGGPDPREGVGSLAQALACARQKDKKSATTHTRKVSTMRWRSSLETRWITCPRHHSRQATSEWERNALDQRCSKEGGGAFGAKAPLEGTWIFCLRK